MEHSARKERETAREHRAQESVRSDRASGVFLECINEVVKSSLEDGEKAEAHHDRTDVRANPVEVFCACPTEDEHTAGEEHRAEHHGRETSFRDGAVVVRFEALDVKFLVGEVDAPAHHNAD